MEIRRTPDAKAVRVAVLDSCGDPAVGEPKIRDVRTSKGDVVVTYGKHCVARIGLETLTVRCVGCD